MTNKLEKVSFIVLLITILLAPLVFVPSVYAPLDMIKTVVITSGVLVACILYLISIFKSRALLIPRHPIFILSCILVLSLLTSTFLSLNPMKSFFGQGFEVGTLSFILTLFAASLLTIYLTFKKRDKILYVYGTVLISFILVALFQIIRFFFGADVVTLGIFQTGTASLVGKWSDVAIFAGAVFILSYITLRSMVLKKSFKVALVALSIAAAFCVFIVNSVFVWGALALVLVFLAVYEFYINSTASSFIKRIPITTIILFATSVLFVVNGATITSRVLGSLNIPQTEITLPWQLTLDVASDTLKESPLFGAGPNRFANEYLKYKPLVVNPSQFWNTEFSSGFGWIHTFIVTGGFIGFLLWIIVIALFCQAGIKNLKNTTDVSARFFTVSTFFSSAFLWIMTLLYVPSQTNLFLTFIFSGLFVASLIQEGKVSLTPLGKNETGILKKLIPLILIIALVTAVLWLFVFLKKIVALSYFQSGISSLNLPNNEGLPKAEENFKKALSLDVNDTYYQALSEVNIIKISMLASQLQAEAQKTGQNPNPESMTPLTQLVEEAKGYTKAAIALDSNNYYNYVAQARISEVAWTLQVDKDAYETIVGAYTNALTYNPYSPSLYLSRARAHATANKLEEAKRDIGLSLQLKQNYLDAIFFLSQIQISQGEIKQAITSVQVASQINPTNPLIFFQLGFLYYNDKNYTAAIDALNQALKLDNNYANAQYFLGLSYARVGKVADAIIQFEALSVSNADNQEVALILANLRAGKSPFTDAKPPVDSKPEQRKNLPIKGK